MQAEHQTEAETERVSSQSVARYTARLEDSGEVVRCSAVQSDQGHKLYSASSNLTLRVVRPAPLLATHASANNRRQIRGVCRKFIHGRFELFLL